MTPGTLPLLLSLLVAQPAPTPPPAPPSEPARSTVPGIAPMPGQPNLLASGVPELPPELRRRVDQYLEVRHASLLDVSDDGKQLLITTRFGDTNQLHVVEQPMGARTQLTFAPEPLFTGQFLPGNPRFLFFLQDVGGGEFYQVYRLDRDTGRTELLTDGKSRHEELVVSGDGRWLAYSGTGRNGKDADVYVAPVDDAKQARRLVEAEGTWYPVRFSRDGSQLLVTRFRAADDSELYAVDMKTGERRPLTPKEGKGSFNGAVFTPDGKSVYLITDRYSDFAELYKVDVAKGLPTEAPMSLTRGIRWNVEALSLSPDGRTLAFSVNEDGYSRVYLLDTRTSALTPVETPRGVMGGLTFPRRRSDTLFFGLTTATSPADVWQLDLRTKKTVRWTRSEVGGLNTATFVEPVQVSYEAKDGVRVPAMLYLPRKASGKVPVVIIFHGGPEGQSRPWLSSFVQFLTVELGMAALVPNVRGSEGYGKAYRAMDDGVKREQSLEDIRAAVDMVGISSIPTFLENTQAYRRDLRRAEYGDERDPEVRKVQERISPLNAVDRIQAALFVQQGANDPRVPQSEAEQIVRAVRARGRDVWYVLALDEGHGFSKKPHRDTLTLATFLFLEKHLGAPAAPTGR